MLAKLAKDMMYKLSRIPKVLCTVRNCASAPFSQRCCRPRINRAEEHLDDAQEQRKGRSAGPFAPSPKTRLAWPCIEFFPRPAKRGGAKRGLRVGPDVTRTDCFLWFTHSQPGRQVLTRVETATHCSTCCRLRRPSPLRMLCSPSSRPLVGCMHVRKGGWGACFSSLACAAAACRATLSIASRGWAVESLECTATQAAKAASQVRVGGKKPVLSLET